MKYLCNPVNIDYRYQFNLDQRAGNKITVGREAADPSMICFHDRYYIFASMNLKVWVSDDLVHWESHRLPDSLPLYDYAPDARVLGDYVYLCASNAEHQCNHYRTKDILNGPYEEIRGDFDFWDPNLFVDDDGRVYFYWGCSNVTPVWGVEKDPETMKNIGEPTELIHGDPFTKGYERNGEDNSIEPTDPETVEAKYQEFLKDQKPKMEAMKKKMTPEQAAQLDVMFEKYKPKIRGMFTNMPYIEGTWMTKHDGRYYLQYAVPGTQYNIYADGVYVSDQPLGTFYAQKSNPFSFKPGGFLPGAGHGSTMKDLSGNWWHASTMRISKNFNNERRVGIWPCGFDKDGELFCNQRYGDWPLDVEEMKQNPWRKPKWYLMSYNAKMTASSYTGGKEPSFAADENVQTWWQAETADSGEWIEMDLGKTGEVHFIQINFADDGIKAEPAGEIHGVSQARWIDDRKHYTRWKLEGSRDGQEYFVIEDKSDAETDLSHDDVIREDGIQVRYLKLTVIEVPFHQKAAVSGLRVFGAGHGAKPQIPSYTVKRTADRDMQVEIRPDAGAEGFNILWGEDPDKLYHSWMIFGTSQKKIGALVKGQEYYVRVDAFNENGITEGKEVIHIGG